MKPITFITGNPKKVEQLGLHFPHPFLHQDLDLPEIQSLDLDEIIIDKANRAFEIIKSPVLVEDVSLVFHSLNNLPGPLIKWFLKDIGYDGLCDLLRDKKRDAHAEVAYGYHDGEKCHVFKGRIDGKIAESLRGDTSFGWSPIFIPDGYTKTWAEMNKEEQAETSMRRIALLKLINYLEY